MFRKRRDRQDIQSPSGTMSQSQKMNIQHLPASDPWRVLVEGPNFLKYPPRDLNDPGVTYQDVYIHRLDAELDKRPWIPQPEIDAFVRAQVMRLSFALQSGSINDLAIALNLSSETTAGAINGLIDEAESIHATMGPLSQMAPQDFQDQIDHLNTTAYALIGVAAENPAVGVADSVVAAVGTFLLMDDVEREAQGSELADVENAARSMASVTAIWAKSPYREALAVLPPPSAFR